MSANSTSRFKFILGRAGCQREVVRARDCDVVIDLQDVIIDLTGCQREVVCARDCARLHVPGGAAAGLGFRV